MTPRVLMLVGDDWANTGWAMAQAYRAANIPMYAFKLRPHPFGYEGELPLVSAIKREDLDRLFAEANLLHFMHSAIVTLPGWDLSTKKVIVQHGGTVYRQNAPSINSIVNPVASMCFIETADLLHLGARNARLFPPPVDTETLLPRLRDAKGHGPRIIGHFPSNPDVKGTEGILRVLKRLHDHPSYHDRLAFNVSPDITSHPQNIDRIRGCDIYIDVFKNVQGDKRYGEYGVTGREAAALGCVVVSAHLGRADYEEAFGPSPIVPAHTEEELEFALRNLLDEPPEVFESRRRDTRTWIERVHSIPATGHRLRNVIEAIQPEQEPDRAHREAD